jgi:uncharacterized protein (TIGR02646 family)
VIPIPRVPLASPLREECARRDAELRTCLDRGEEPPPALLIAYRNPDLKQHLVAEAHAKCMYCESKITHAYFGDIEHIKPKSSFPAERLSVTNLGLACAICNNHKGEFWHAPAPVLDPYSDDPESEFLAFGFFITRKPGRDRARLTVEKLQLNRTALVERRKERIQLLENLADQYIAAPDGPLRDLLRDELLRYAATDSEYAFIVRAYLKAACGLAV